MGCPSSAVQAPTEAAEEPKITLLKIKEGKTVDEVGEFFAAADEGPPDFAAAPLDFFTLVVDAEQDRVITVDLSEGQWAIGTPDPEAPSEAPTH